MLLAVQASSKINNVLSDPTLFILTWWSWNMLVWRHFCIERIGAIVCYCCCNIWDIGVRLFLSHNSNIWQIMIQVCMSTHPTYMSNLGEDHPYLENLTFSMLRARQHEKYLHALRACRFEIYLPPSKSSQSPLFVHCIYFHFWHAHRACKFEIYMPI